MIIVWRVTEHCNLGCRFCGFDRNLERPRRAADVDRVLRFGRVLAEHAERGRNGVMVSWIGGEPLVWPELSCVTEAFRRSNVRMSTTTNGAPLSSPEVRRHVIEHYAELTVSIDGIGEVFDRLRGWPGGFSLVRKGIRTLAEEKKSLGSGPKLRANVVLMRGTIGQFEELCFELASWGIEEATFNQLGGNDRPEFYPENRLLPDQADRFASELAGLRRRLAVRGFTLLGNDGYVRRIQATAKGFRMPVADCGPGSGFLFIDADGRVSPCSFTADECFVAIDEIRSAAELAALSTSFSKQRELRRPRACGDCHSTQVFEKFTEVR